MKICALLRLNISLFLFAFCCLFLPFPSFATPSALVIDEFQIAGESASDTYFIIANYGLSAVPLKDYGIRRYTASGLERYSAVIFSSFGSYSLMPNHKVMVCSDSYEGTRFPDTFVYTYDTTKKFSSNNSIILFDGKIMVDIIGYRDNSEITIKYFEGTPITPGPKAGEIYVRNNKVENNDNAKDFDIFITPVVVDVNADKFVISELLPNSDDGSEWFELYNPTNLDIFLGNLKICDAMGRVHCYYFDKSDFIPAGKYKTYAQGVTKITLNNTGDWLELYDTAESLITDSGGNYGSAEKGISLALFGNEYQWTKSMTPGEQNIYTDIIEIEEVAKKVVKTTKSRVKAPKLATSQTSTPEEELEILPEDEEAEVKSAKTEQMTEKSVIGRKTLGWGLIGLAILLLVSYICWYFRSYAKNIYDKIRHRDDSARF